MQSCMLCVQSESMGLLGGGAEPVELGWEVVWAAEEENILVC